MDTSRVCRGTQNFANNQRLISGSHAQRTDAPVKIATLRYVRTMSHLAKSRLGMTNDGAAYVEAPGEEEHEVRQLQKTQMEFSDEKPIASLRFLM